MRGLPVDHVDHEAGGVGEAHALAAAGLGVGLDRPADAFGHLFERVGAAGEQPEADMPVLGTQFGHMHELQRTGGPRVERLGRARDRVQAEVGEERLQGVEVGHRVANEGDVTDRAHEDLR